MHRSDPAVSRLDGESDWLNWPLLVLIALVPLQNIYLGKLSTLGSGINILNVLMLLSFIVASPRRETTYANSVNKYILLYAASYLLSFIVSISVLEYDFKAPTYLKDMFFAYLFFFVTYKSITGMKALKGIFWATVVPLPYMFRVFYSNFTMTGHTTYQDKLRFNNGTFMELGSNELAAFYATYTFILIAFSLLEKNRKYKWLLFGCIAMNLYSVLYSFSRGAYLSVIVGLIVFCLLNKKIKLVFITALLLFILFSSGVDIFPNAVTERFNSSFVEEDNLESSAKTRLVLWSIAMDKFSNSPIVGVGFGNFKKMNEFGLDTHNYYVKLLVEGGLIGFFAFIPIIIVSIRKGLLLLNDSKSEFVKKLAIGFLACLSALVVGNYFGDRFTPYPLIAYFYVYLAIITKVCEWSRNKNNDM